MQSTINQDTTTQAMTEVALGLSMAFFAILIVALLSMSMPGSESAADVSVDEAAKITAPQTDEHIKLTKSTETSESESPAAQEKPQFLFLHQGQIYTQSLAVYSAEALETEQPVFLAVPASLPMQDVMAAKAQINHPNLSITLLNDAWQTRLEQLP